MLALSKTPSSGARQQIKKIRKKVVPLKVALLKSQQPIEDLKTHTRHPLRKIITRTVGVLLNVERATCTRRMIVAANVARNLGVIQTILVVRNWLGSTKNSQNTSKAARWCGGGGKRIAL